VPGIIFDFDGVIVDSEPVHEAALLEAAKTLGMSFTHQQYLDELIGFDDRDFYPALCRLNARQVVQSEWHAFFAAKKPAVKKALASGAAAPYPGTINLIKEAARREIPISVCSGALRAEIEIVLDALSLRSVFRAIVSADDVPHSKPDPTGYRMAARALDLAPAECVAIEDTPTGCQSAISAGIAVVAVGHSLPQHVFPSKIAAFRQNSSELTLDELLAFAGR
jgi:HAD superfamily hydrolase (TIGR01509 family)